MEITGLEPGLPVVTSCYSLQPRLCSLTAASVPPFRANAAHCSHLHALAPLAGSRKQAKKKTDNKTYRSLCGDNRTRTGYLQIANLSLYQVSYIPKVRKA